MDTSKEKKAVMAFRKFFEVCDIHQSYSGLQITPEIYIKCNLILLFDLTPDCSASEGYTSHPDNGNVVIEQKFSKALPDAITCLIYPEYDGTVLIDDKRAVRTD